MRPAFSPVKWGTLYLAPFNSLRLVQLNWTCTSKPKLQQKCARIRWKARLDGVGSQVYSRWFGISFACAHKSCEIQMSSLKSAQKWMAVIATNTRMDEFFWTDMDSVFQAVEISPRVKRVMVQNRFTPQKACQEQACAPSPSPRAGTVAVPGCMHGVVLAHRNSCSVMAGEQSQQGALEPNSNSR